MKAAMKFAMKFSTKRGNMEGNDGCVRILSIVRIPDCRELRGLKILSHQVIC